MILLLAAVIYGTYQYRVTAPESGVAKEIGGMAAYWSPLENSDPAADGSVLAGTGASRPLAVAVGPVGVIAVGDEIDHDGSTDVAVWGSIDGAEWARVPDGDGALGGPGTQGARGVAAWPTGGAHSGFVVVGLDTLVTGVNAPVDGSEPAESDAAVWISATGVDWQRVGHDVDDLGGPGAQVMEAVTPVDDGMVAVGWTRTGLFQGEAAAWVSSDGRAWRRVESDAFGGPGERRMLAVTTFPDGVVAVGWESGTDGVHHPAAWVSNDGTAWARATNVAGSVPLATLPSGASLDHLPIGELRSVMVTSEQVLAAGHMTGIAGERVGDTDGALWTSSNGITWNAILPIEQGTAIFGGPGRQSLVSVVAAQTTDGLRFVAVGETQRVEPADDPAGFPDPVGFAGPERPEDAGDGASGSNPEGATYGPPVFATWWSADGNVWRPQGVLGVGDLGSSSATALITLEDRFLALGTAGEPDADAEPAAWYLRLELNRSVEPG